MKKFIYLLLIIPLFLTSCVDDDQRCATCPNAVSQYGFDVCESENGNAIVLGDELDVDYDEFVKSFHCK